MKTAATLRQDARDIWLAGVNAVRSDRLVHNVCQRTGNLLQICGEKFDLRGVETIAVVGAGKAGAGMAAAIEDVLEGDYLAKVQGWVNVPADCVQPLKRIILHPARPAGVNEPTAEGVAGSERILEIVSSLKPNDICLVLLSGGGSALLPAPVSEISLQDKQAVTRFLMHGGATIHELNTVRKQLSRIKGGGLARAATSDRVVTLIISDVIGDPLDVIASGPTVADFTTAADAMEILQRFGASPPEIPQSVFDYLARERESGQGDALVSDRVVNHIIGNNDVAVTAAAERAQELGYSVQRQPDAVRGDANEAGVRLAEVCRSIRDGKGPVLAPACVLSGGEPIVHLTKTSQPRKGGRNQQLVLAALEVLRTEGGLSRIAILSGGTDGEDGPTDAAGAVIDAELAARIDHLQLDPAHYLSINDAYTFFAACEGLVKTGPTHTNVMDVQLGLVAE